MRIIKIFSIAGLILAVIVLQLLIHHPINVSAEFVPNQIIARFEDGVPQSTIDSIIATNGMSVIEKITFDAVPEENEPAFDIYVLDTGLNTVEQALIIMKQDSNVTYAIPHVIYQSAFHLTEPTDPDYPIQWGLNNRGQDMTGAPAGSKKGIIDADIDAPQGWDHKKKGDCSCKIIAVLDTGAFMAHVDLDANIYANPGEIPGNGIDDDGNGFIDDGNGWDFVNGDNNPADDNGHGTHVAGIIAMEANGLGGVGVCWDAKLMIVKVLDGNGRGNFNTIALGIIYAVNNGAKIINMSIQTTPGTIVPFPDDLAMRVALWWAKINNVLVVAAAGNYLNNNDINPVYPASYGFPNIISVAASDNKDILATWPNPVQPGSNFGRNSVDLAAPGKDIWSTLPPIALYGFNSGTSMAAPFVTGVAAQCWCLLDPNMNYLAVKKQILNRVDPRLRPPPP